LIKWNTTMQSDTVWMIWELLDSLTKPKAFMSYLYFMSENPNMTRPYLNVQDLDFLQFNPIKTTALFSSTPTLDFHVGAGRQTLVI